MSDPALPALGGDVEALIGRALLGELDEAGRRALDALRATDPRVAEALELLEQTQVGVSTLLTEGAPRAEELPPFLRPQRLAARLWWKQRIVGAVSLLATARLAHSGALAARLHGLGGPLSETWPLFFAVLMAVALPLVLWRQWRRRAEIAAGGPAWSQRVEQLGDEAIARWRRRRRLLFGLLAVCGGAGAYLATRGSGAPTAPGDGAWDLVMLLAAGLVLALSVRRR